MTHMGLRGSTFEEDLCGRKGIAWPCWGRFFVNLKRVMWMWHPLSLMWLYSWQFVSAAEVASPMQIQRHCSMLGVPKNRCDSQTKRGAGKGLKRGLKRKVSRKHHHGASSKAGAA